MIFYWIISMLISALTLFTAGGTPLESYADSPLIVQYIGNSRPCDDLDAIQWSADFHECFMERKYNDGGRNLNSIVDRILNHAEDCAEKTKRDCRPDFLGFKVVLNKTITQIKDYSETYLEQIYTGRENIKDLGCVEEVLDLETYENCFKNVFPRNGANRSEGVFKRDVKGGISCANRANDGCSTEAKIYLNRIVRILCGVEQPIGEEIVEKKVNPTPAPPMYWYDYIAQPFITAWHAVKSFFSSLFG